MERLSSFLQNEDYTTSAAEILITQRAFHGTDKTGPIGGKFDADIYDRIPGFLLPLYPPLFS